MHSMPQGMGSIKMTPRLLVQNLGGVYSTPQGTDLKFVEIGTRLLTWMASASCEVECSGSIMYNTPSILAQLGECDIHLTMCCHIRVFSTQPANSPDTKVRISPLLVQPHTCRLGFQPRWNTFHGSGHSRSIGAHPGTPKIVMCATREDDVSSQW